jgi:D-tyrosyl-tRNA(Tyr) deacylase
MRAVVQRVKQASVTFEGTQQASIGKGLLVLVGIEDEDNNEDVEWLSGKLARLRIFGDDQGLMNLSVKDVGGDIILVSQFTLHASTKKGNRPAYIKAAKPDVAIPIYESMVNQLCTDLGKPIGTGIFGADMQVELINDGPVTIIIDTKNRE